MTKRNIDYVNTNYPGCFEKYVRCAPACMANLYKWGAHHNQHHLPFLAKCRGMRRVPPFHCLTALLWVTFRYLRIAVR